MMPTVTLIVPADRATDDRTSFLAPGQRYRSHDRTEVYTISSLNRDKLGLLHVTLRAGTGRELSAFAEQVETAIRIGDLVPITSGGVLARC